MLVVMDSLMSEYKWTIEYMLGVRLAQAFALFAAIQLRYGAEPAGPTYAEQELTAALRASS